MAHSGGPGVRLPGDLQQPHLVPEVAGDGALIHEPDDYAAIAEDIQRLQEPPFATT